jgi:hypothetical protein
MRRHLNYPTVAATLALVFSMTGGALAASHYVLTSTKQIKPSVLAQLRKPGPAGPKGATGLEGPGRIVELHNTIVGQAGATGPQGATGQRGFLGEAGRSAFIWAGAWYAGGDYAQGVDVVQSAGEAWICVHGNTPANTCNGTPEPQLDQYSLEHPGRNWELFAR